MPATQQTTQQPVTLPGEQPSNTPVYIRDIYGNLIDVSGLTAKEFLDQYGDQLIPSIRDQLKETYDQAYQTAVDNGWLDPTTGSWIGSGAQRGDGEPGNSANGGGSIAVPQLQSVVDHITDWLSSLPVVGDGFANLFGALQQPTLANTQDILAAPAA